MACFMAGGLFCRSSMKLDVAAFLKLPPGWQMTNEYLHLCGGPQTICSFPLVMGAFKTVDVYIGRLGDYLVVHYCG